MRCLSARIPIHDPARLDQEACARFPLHIYIPFWLSLSQPRLRFPPQIPYYTEFRGISLEQVITITFWKLIMRSRIENYRRCTVSRYTVVCRRFDERYVTFSSEWVAELNDETIDFYLLSEIFRESSCIFMKRCVQIIVTFDENFQRCLETFTVYRIIR